MLRRIRIKGQSLSEYALIFGLVVGAIVAVQPFVKRALQAKAADAAGAVMDVGRGAQLSVGGYSVSLPNSRQWEPGYIHSQYTTTQGSNLTETMSGGSITRTQNENSQRSGSQTTDAPQ